MTCVRQKKVDCIKVSLISFKKTVRFLTRAILIECAAIMKINNPWCSVSVEPLGLSLCQKSNLATASCNMFSYSSSFQNLWMWSTKAAISYSGHMMRLHVFLAASTHLLKQSSLHTSLSSRKTVRQKMQTSTSGWVVLYRNYPKVHEMVSDGTSGADFWEDLREFSRRISFTSNKSKTSHYGRGKHTNVICHNELSLRSR